MEREAHDDSFAAMFRTLAETSSARAPLHAAMSRAVARHRTLPSLLEAAPTGQRVPVLVLAAIHLLVRRTPDHPLAGWYPIDGRRPARSHDDAALDDALAQFAASHLSELERIVAERHVQTNEVGRCALLLPSLAAAADEAGRPLVRLDIGASAGLTLLVDRFVYAYELDDGRTHVVAESGDDEVGVARHEGVGRRAVELSCGVRGPLGDALPARRPAVVHSRGIDPRPIDVTDDDQVDWLVACCWADEVDRITRLRGAIDLARRHRPDVVAGTASDVDDHLRRLSARHPDAHPVITTSWALSYLTSEGRVQLLDDLDAIGSSRDLDWVFAESPAQTPELPHPTSLAGEHITAVVRVSWRSGARRVVHVARAHPHGHWMHGLS